MWSWSGATTTSRTGRSSRRRFGAARLSPIPTVRERLCGGPRELLDPLSELLDLQAKVGDGIPGVRLGAGEERLQLDLGAIAHEIEELASFRLELLGPRGRAALCCVKHFLDAILQLVQLTRREHFRPPCDALRDDGIFLMQCVVPVKHDASPRGRGLYGPGSPATGERRRARASGIQSWVWTAHRSLPFPRLRSPRRRRPSLRLPRFRPPRSRRCSRSATPGSSSTGSSPGSRSTSASWRR